MSEVKFKKKQKKAKNEDISSSPLEKDLLQMDLFEHSKIKALNNLNFFQDLDMRLIEEDPCQPRNEFNEELLLELANTISLRGVKTPISVRPNPKKNGYYIINHGARRFRASKLAKKNTIPAYIDKDYTEYDQVIENLHRDGLTPREIANFIGREMAKGFNKKQISKLLGKSPAFITQHSVLLDLPEVIAQVFNAGLCQDVTVLNEIVTVYKSNPQEVSDWLEVDNQIFNRKSIKLFREYLEHENEINKAEIQSSPKIVQGTEIKTVNKRYEVVVEYAKKRAILNLKKPSLNGFVSIRFDDSLNEVNAKMAALKIVDLV